MVTSIEAQPMFTHLIPVQTNLPNNYLSNPPSLRTMSMLALPQSNIIPIHGANISCTEVIANDLQKQNEIMNNLKQPTVIKKIGGKTYWPYPMANNVIPDTWYHVQAGDNIITVGTNDRTNITTNQDCPTPVLDEWPSPSSPAATLPKCNPGEGIAHPVLRDSGTNTFLTTRETGSYPIRDPTQDRGTITEPKDTRDIACSPIRPPMSNIGTDPINWWLESTRQFLKK
jgi:hypothetical protein